MCRACAWSPCWWCVQGTRVDKVINELFEGHILSYIRCLNVDYQSERKETFMDLQASFQGGGGALAWGICRRVERQRRQA